MFEDRTFENILAECLGSAPKEIDIRKNSVFYDAIFSSCFTIARFYADLRTAFDLVLLPTAVGEYLDRKGTEYKVLRHAATSAIYFYEWTGDVVPLAGERFFASGLYFTLKNMENRTFVLVAEATGDKHNHILPGTPAVPLNNISGLKTSVFGSLVEPGAKIESDEDYRERIQEKLAGPSENGNRSHYKTWCESVDGVAKARIVPLFAGENTVMGILIGTDGKAATQMVIDRVQEYIDPITLGGFVVLENETIPIGDGLGDGRANIGAHFAAIAPVEIAINIEFVAEVTTGTSTGAVQAEMVEALEKYLRELVFSTPDRQNVVVRISAINGLLYSLPGMIDYRNLTLNGATANIELSYRQIAIPGEVVVHAPV